MKVLILSKKQLILFTLFFTLVASSTALAQAQTSDSNLIAVLYESPQSNLIGLANNQLTFSGDSTTGSLDRIIIIAGLEDNVQVKVIPEKLYDISSQNEITVQVNPSSFLISKNEQSSVKITVDISDKEAETYNGSIIITASTADKSATTNIDINVVITEETKNIFETILSKQNQIIVIAIVLSSLAIALIFAHFDKLVIAIGISFAALIFWFSSMVVSIIETNIVAAISTAVIVPFAAYIINQVKSKSDAKTEKIKAAKEILVEASKEDIDWLRKVIGETTTHYASFNPKFEGVKEISRCPETIYHKNGVLKRNYWDANYKQGSAADLPALHLEKYYDYVDLYNSYYEAAMMLTKGKTIIEFEKLEKKDWFIKFETFRKKYAELETVLFVYISYLIGLFGQNRMSPMKVEYPRITRVLLYKLLEYGVLKPQNYVLQKKYFLRSEFKNKKSKKCFETHLEYKFYFEEKNEVLIEKTKKETKSEYPKDSVLEKRKYDKWYEEKFEEEKSDLKKEIEKKKNSPNYKKLEVDWIESDNEWAIRRLFKKKIEKWDFTAKESDEILKDIYEKDDIPTFYYKVGQDFRYTFTELLESIKDLVPLPPKFVAREKTLELLKDHKIQKELLNDLEKLKKLKDDHVIEDPEFKATQKEIFENFNSLNKQSRKNVLIEEFRQLEISLKLKLIGKTKYKQEKKRIKTEIDKIQIP